MGAGSAALSWVDGKDSRLPAETQYGAGVSLDEVWRNVVGVQPAPAPLLVIASAVVAFAAVAIRPVWRVVRTVVTIPHEGGHAAIALATGRRLSGVRLHSDASGLTVSVGRPHGPGMIATALAGYPAPALTGLAGAWMLAAGHITALLWISILLLACLLIAIRNGFGVVSVLVTGGAFFLVSWYGSADTQAAFAYAFVWFLLIASVRPVADLQAGRRRGQGSDSDADQLARLTGVPGILWVLLFGLISLGALVSGAVLLWPYDLADLREALPLPF
ncbi:MAG: M50 family peptidase [Streptosporangiales bacterium]|nr:M50 family peptidase [Streptosporangiales bacterium]